MDEVELVVTCNKLCQFATFCNNLQHALPICSRTNNIPVDFAMHRSQIILGQLSSFNSNAKVF